MNYEYEIEVLKSQLKSLRRTVHAQGELIDTIRSPLWKRLWWLIHGYRMFKVGRWYKKTDDLK